MKTDTTQKDQALHEVIAWCESELNAINMTYLTQKYWNDTSGSTWNDGMRRAYNDVINHCKDMLSKETDNAD